MSIITQATSGDLQALADLHATSFASGLERPWRAEDFKESLKMSGMCCLVVKEGGTLAAFLLFRQILEEAEIISIGVDPGCQRRGYASRLLQFAIEGMRERNIEKIILEVRDDNYAAMYLYKGFGFEEVGQRLAYYRLSNGQRKDAKLYCLFIK